MLKLIFLVTVLSLSAKAGRHRNFYRKDYTYFQDFDAYYKLHWDKSGNSWSAAFIVCDDEGSQLFYPKEEGEWAIVKNLTALLAKAPNTTSVIVGIHDETGLGEFVTIDGQPTPSPISDIVPTGGQDCVIMDMTTGKYSLDSCITSDPLKWRLYVCKKIDESPCPTVDLEYKYAKETNKCYKVNKRIKTWPEASHTCLMEGGMLVVPENQAEINLLKQMIKLDQRYYVGFRRLFAGGNYYTVKGQKIEDSGFPAWRDEHDNDCGVLWNNYGNLYKQTRECDKYLPFICEMHSRF